MKWLTPLVDFIADVGSLAWEFTVNAAMIASLLAMVVLLVNLLFRRWLTATQMSLLWGLVLLRLVLPWAPASSLSLQNLLVQPADVQPHTVEEWISQPRTADVATIARSQPSATLSQLPEPTWFELTGLTMIFDWPFGTLLFAWPCGMFLILASAAILNWRFSSRVSRTPICIDPRLTTLWHDCCQLAGVRKSIPIVVFDGVDQPAVMGVLHSKLLLPVDLMQLGDEQMRMIMLHELAHIRRWDVAQNWLLLVIRAIHWWNPVYWLAAARFCNLREQACDEFVIRRLNGERARSYGELLLKLAQRNSGPRRWRVLVPASILTIISSTLRRRSIGNRIYALRRAALVRSRRQLVTAGVFIVVMAWFGLTNANPTSNQDIDSHPSVFAHPFVEGGVGAPPAWSNSVLITRDYDVGDVLVDSHRTIEAAHRELKAILSLNWENHQLEGNRLTVTTTGMEHERLAEHLRKWAAGDVQITVESRFLTSLERLKSADEIVWHYLPSISKSDDEEDLLTARRHGSRPTAATVRMEEQLPVIYAILNPQLAKSLLNEAQLSTRANITQAPKVTCFSGQLAVIKDVSQRPFVVGLGDSEPGSNAPTIVIVEEGSRLAIRPVLIANQGRVLLNGRLDLSRIGEVAEVNVRSITAGPATVQAPLIKRCVIDIATEVPSGHSLLIGSMPNRSSRHDNVYVLLTPTEVH